jgi:hypothetical protein
MKIICVDNFDRENVSDQLVAENVPKHYAEFLVEKLNDKFSGSSSSSFFRVVPDDHILFVFEP